MAEPENSNNAPPQPAEGTPNQATTTPPIENKPAEGEALTVEAIKLPEGFEAPKEVLDNFVGIMNDPALPPAERAQKLVDLQAGLMKEASEKNSQLWTETQEKWANDVKALPQIGGDNLDRTLGGIAKLIDTTMGGEANKLREVMDLTGAGNHPVMVKFLHNLATKLVAEGEPVSGSPTGTRSDPAERLFPNQGKA